MVIHICDIVKRFTQHVGLHGAMSDKLVLSGTVIPCLEVE